MEEGSEDGEPAAIPPRERRIGYSLPALSRPVIPAAGEQKSGLM